MKTFQLPPGAVAGVEGDEARWVALPKKSILWAIVTMAGLWPNGWTTVVWCGQPFWREENPRGIGGSLSPAIIRSWSSFSQTCVVLEAGSPRQTIVCAIGCFALVSHSCIWSPWVSSDTSVVIDLLQSSLCLAHYWETRLLWTYWQKQNTGHWGFWLRPSGWSWTCEVRRWCFQYCLGEIWENARWNSGRKGRFAGVLRGLAISHPTHPHLGEISQKKTSFVCLFFGGAPLLESNEGNILCW